MAKEPGIASNLGVYAVTNPALSDYRFKPGSAI
jgi:hypothetical protein